VAIFPSVRTRARRRRLRALLLILLLLLAVAAATGVSPVTSPVNYASFERVPGASPIRLIPTPTEFYVPWFFTGRVFQEEAGGGHAPREGVTVQLFGSAEPVYWGDGGALAAPWGFLVQGATDAEGWYELTITADDGTEYAALLLSILLPDGSSYSGATSPVGWPVPDAPVIIFTSDGYYGEPSWQIELGSTGVLNENNFWLSPSGGFDLVFGEVGHRFDGPDLVVWAEVINTGNMPSPPASAVAQLPELAWWGDPVQVPSLAPGDWVTVLLPLPILDSLRDRTVDVFVYIDPDDELPELNEDNNFSWEPAIYIPPLPLPDLVVSFDYSEIEHGGETVVLVVRVANQGQARAGEHLLAAWSAGGIAGETRVPPLAPGDDQTIEIWIGVPDHARGTRVTFTVEVDAGGEVAESNEENNTIRTPTVVIPPLPAPEEPSGTQLPDLVVAYVGRSFTRDQESLVLELRVSNQGPVTAGANQLAVQAPGWDSASHRITSLVPGSARTVEIEMRVPESALGTAVSFTLEVDANDSVRESNERNNVARTPRLSIPRRDTPQAPASQPDQLPRARPDLLVTLDRAAIRDGGQTLMLSLWVTNQGGARAADHHFTVSAPGWQAISRSVSALDSGTRRRVEVTLDVPPSARGRSVPFTIVADSQDEITESNETNNRMRTSLQIPVPVPPSTSPSPQPGLPPWVVPAAGAGALLILVLTIRYFVRRGGEGPPEEEPGEPAPLPPVRLLRLWVTEGASGEGPPVAQDRPLVPGAAYTLHLQVQPRGEPAARAAAGAGTELDVVFFTPTADFGMDRTATLHLPARGASDEIRRPFVPARAGRHQIRAAIYYRNNLLQSAVLDAAVEAAGAPRQPGAVRRFIDYVASARLDNLDHYPHPALNIFVNATAGGSHWIGLYSGDARAAPELRSGDLHTYTPLQLDTLAQRTRSLFLRIEGLKRYSHETPLPLDEPTLARRERNMVDLARNGYRLFDELFLSHEPGLQPDRLEAFHELLQEPATISVARCRGDSTTIPWAALYGRYVDVEKELSLCPVFKKQVVDNQWSADYSRLVRKRDLLDNPGACARQDACPGRGPDRHTTVCPFGFWGLMHQIEQPLQQVTPTPVDEVPPELQDRGFDQTMYLERPPQSRVTMALNAFPRLRYAERHRDQFDSLAQDGALEIVYETDRDRVLALLQQGGRHLYYFYCHGVVDGEVFKLKLGPADNPGYISSASLNPLAIHWPSQPHPLIILNGCATMALAPELIHGFMGKLRRLGAAGIVGSEVQVWEGLACPFGYLIVERLLSGRSLGEAFLDTRRALQRQLNPLGLVYAYYAFAGLHLHDPENCEWCRARRPAVA
jgi:subtilase family serine protease